MIGWFYFILILWFILIWFILKLIDEKNSTAELNISIPTYSNTQSAPRPRHPLNADGDFYVEKDSCVLCGAPEAEATGLMGHSDDGCYFIRQPETKAEIECAINAIAVSCVAAVRYGGTDQEIIKRIHEAGCATECDHPLIK